MFVKMFETMLGQCFGLFLGDNRDNVKETLQTEDWGQLGCCEYMGGTSQEGKRPKNWEFYPLRIGFS